MSDTTNHQNTSELSWLLDQNKQSIARIRDRNGLRTRILKTERKLLGDDVSYKRYLDPECKNRDERIVRIIDEALDKHLLQSIFPQISCTDQWINKRIFDHNLKHQRLYWSLWHVVSMSARKIVEGKHTGIQTIYIDHMENARKYGDPTTEEVERQFRPLFKADLKKVRKLKSHIRMELEDYVIWAGCAYLIILQEKDIYEHYFKNTAVQHIN